MLIIDPDCLACVNCYRLIASVGTGQARLVNEGRGGVCCDECRSGEVRVSTHWGVAHNYPERHRSVMQYDDEESAREMAPLYGEDACVVRCTVTTTPWERADPPAAEPVDTEADR